jgi:hypothetical protein
VDIPSSRILLRPGDLDRIRRFCRDVLGLATYRELSPRMIPPLADAAAVRGREIT